MIKAAQMKENEVFSLRPIVFAHTLLFCQIIIKSALTWLEYTDKNIWGGESPTSATTYGLAIAFKHEKQPFFENQSVFILLKKI